MKRLVWILPLAILWACAAGPVPRPEWLDDPSLHPDAPASRFLTGVGSARTGGEDARAVARQRAVEEIVSSIVADVRADLELHSRNLRIDDDVTWVEELVENVRISADESQLPGIEVVETWRDESGDNLYALVTVPRDRLISQYLSAAGRNVSQGRELLESAKRQEAADPGRALLEVLAAHELLGEAYGLASRAQVVASPTSHASNTSRALGDASQLLATAAGDLSRLSGRVRIVKVGGDGQQGFVTASLTTPLAARLEFAGDAGTQPVPLTDFPILFEAAISGSCVVTQASTTTDASGGATCTISDLRPTGTSANQIIVRPDYGSRAPSLDVARIPSDAFVYTLPTPGTTSVLVAIADDYEGRSLVPMLLGPAVADHLTSKGFDVHTTAPSGATADRIASTPAEMLSTVVGGDFDYILTGRSITTYKRENMGIHWFESTGEVRVVTMREGISQSIELPVEQDGAAAHSPSGARKTLNNLRSVLLQRLDDGFVAYFTPDAE